MGKLTIKSEIMKENNKRGRSLEEMEGGKKWRSGTDQIDVVEDEGLRG